METLGGEKLRLSGLQGKVILLDFWATYCHPCHEMAVVFQKLHLKHRSEGLEVVGVNIDTYTEHVAESVEEWGMGYTVVLDPGRKTAAAYGVRILPVTFLLDRDGTVRRKWSGYRPDTAAEIRAEVGAALQEKTP